MARTDDEDGKEFDINAPETESFTVYINPTDLSYHLCIKKVIKGDLFNVLQDILERLDGGEMDIESDGDILN